MNYFKETTDRWYKEQPEWGTPESTKKAKKMTPNESCCDTCDDIYDHVISESEYQGKKVELNNPFRLPSGSNKKFGVYVKNDKGNVVKVTFGDPNMDIKRDSPERRKSFRARHNCADPGPKWKARYWSFYQWRASAKVDEEAPTNSTGPATATDKPVVRKKRFADFVRRDGKVS